MSFEEMKLELISFLEANDINPDSLYNLDPSHVYNKISNKLKNYRSFPGFKHDADTYLELSTEEERQILLLHPIAAQRFSTEIMKQPWPEAEPIIMTDAFAAVDYAAKFKKGGWPEAEPMITNNTDAANYYKQLLGIDLISKL